ncbi:MAG TPA: lipid-binding SYLF domain-containing protein [Spirochaetia bacterium]|nr:lipid-binding SYLF domain-containing protein [Spirochaetia bacterium]
MTQVLPALAALLLLATGAARAETGREIDAHVNAALDRFVAEVKGGRGLLARANAALVLPKVVKGGIIVGGEYGEGALREGGRTVAYYSVASASLGLTLGGEVKDLIVLFMDESALKKFRRSQGWEAGLDGNIAVIRTGGGASVDTTSVREPIIGFVVGVKGLLVDASFKGSKFSPIKR